MASELQELCRGPLDPRGRLNVCGFCGRKDHLVDNCNFLKDNKDRPKWLEHIIWGSRQGLAPILTKLDYSREQASKGAKGWILKPVLNPDLAKIWERQLVALDKAAKRTPYWKRFNWNSKATGPLKNIINLLPDDPTIPEGLKNRGPPSWKTTNPAEQGFAAVDYMSPPSFNKDWVVFENTPRDPPDTAATEQEGIEIFRKGCRESLNSRMRIKEERDQVTGLDENRQQAAMLAFNPWVEADDIKEEEGSPQAVAAIALPSIKSEPKSP
ncbi:hypothetical protein PG993_010649 [Apiospora rasikravindrae]|uniref:Uncharacterized protein n=1 Tax=Apiospora rasikravindrae TaxID=990691 RepID=A0ABR1SMY0_9PEZI